MGALCVPLKHSENWQITSIIPSITKAVNPSRCQHVSNLQPPSVFESATRRFATDHLRHVECSLSFYMRSVQPAAICYWFIVSRMVWGVLSLIGVYWRPLHASSAAPCLFAMAVGCLANWLRNRSFHCAITGPLFLIGGIMFLLSGVRMIHLDMRWVCFAAKN